MRIRKVEKLVTNLEVHQSPKSSIKTWLEIRKVHRIIGFEQSNWIKP